ncbi:MAG TPA: DUF1549 and DUF1553 domain-containing protein [Gemmataceae bacterium]|nr:DUF1549 and DUF1553 domain-containing protein [Gemmataceae bacterium]
MHRTCLLALLTGLLVFHRDAPAGAAAPKASTDTPAVFHSPRRPSLPAVTDKSWLVNPIDAFILARLEAEKLAPSPRLDRRDGGPTGKLRLLRRVTFDLTGLPPTIAEQKAFLSDTSAEAYRKVVERLLASPRYGERCAQHWLDLVRYAETDGFKADDLRPSAHLYRDYVIRSLNVDLPYDRFVQQQLAGDELEPDNPDALVATGFLHLWPDEYNAANLEQRRQEILDDVTDVTGQVFLGLTFGCARCHDHKYDPILQTDYFQLQAFFAPMRPRDDLPAATPAERRDYQLRLKAWEAASRDIRAEMDKLVADKRQRQREYALGKFRPEIQQAVKTPDEKRTPYQRQIAFIAEKQLRTAEKTAASRLPAESKKRYQELEQKLSALPTPRPQPLPAAMAVTDVGLAAPRTHLLAGGDWRKPREELQPGFPHFLDASPPDIQPIAERKTTGRRSALARWLTRKDHPLTARVLVNRLWQHHFGAGIIGTSSDFGVMGDAATHPQLLDWLAVELVESGWSLKHMHRLMVLSAAYRQDSRVDPSGSVHARALRVDRDNHLLWHARRRRLEGEAIRDAMLALSSELSLRPFGPSARPKLPDNISKYAWKPDPLPKDRHRRSIYVFAKRNMRFPLFDAFDLPDMHNSCSRRLTTTTAPQALLLLNGDFALECGQRLAAVLQERYGEDESRMIAQGYRLAWGRPPREAEIELALRFLSTQTEALWARQQSDGGSMDREAARRAALADFCHALLNTNEFLFLD